MLGRIRKAMDEREGGFTLIELLVVIIIIGILAAIAIPVFLRQREKGYKAAVKSDLKNAATAVESWGTDHNGDYTGMVGQVNAPGAPSALLNGEGFKGSDGVTVTVAQADTQGYCINGSHARLSGNAVLFHYDSDTGAPADGACV